MEVWFLSAVSATLTLSLHLHFKKTGFRQSPNAPAIYCAIAMFIAVLAIAFTMMYVIIAHAQKQSKISPSKIYILLPCIPVAMSFERENLYTFNGIYYYLTLELTPDPPAFYLAAIWTLMTAKWAFVTVYYTREYKIMLENGDYIPTFNEYQQI